jgi:hypothetical protein
MPGAPPLAAAAAAANNGRSHHRIRAMGQFATFSDFYPYYLAEHSNRTCRRLHFAGSSLVIGCLVMAVTSMNAWWLLGTLLCGYGFAWIGHFFFEKNKPATFQYPFYSLAGDWVMYKDMMIGKIRF